ncbi:prepilin-type N-terminal cleavage/methylation domain-containing protein [Sulfurimonas sp.]|jgi:prepilin-type N-terminal cleavage/methylation domain-containing protein|uniref:type IV pilus modification PilV family protein n=1 Tax=Sulfurimonas sp. TaxID=2022749 RepID=UPI0025DEC35A|nr:prepilin-type N-terminal cleavage/methylation domain-containing protein [Sulfurimonas sp.]MBT5935855.1 prepilin-type N-terminal cleavage/methylation domain-containing protein [Sulfurimonas sp.]
MTKRHSTYRSAFTLIEVMVAVMIVSVVIAALLQMRGDTSNKLFQLKKIINTNQYNSFLLSNSENYAFEDSKIDMKRLVNEFELESDLRRKLKAIKTEILYEELEIIDTNELQQSEDEEITDGSGIIFEIGKTMLKTEDFSGTLIRVRLQ